VCRLRKALYRKKQAPRAWYSRIDTYLQQMGFEKSEADPNLYFIVVGEDPLILVLYVDDLFITGAKCNVPKPTCQEHHDFGCLLNFYWLWHFVKHFTNLLICMCLLVG